MCIRDRDNGDVVVLFYAAQTAHDAGFYLVGIQDTTSAADAPALRRICDQFLPDWTALDWAQA